MNPVSKDSFDAVVLESDQVVVVDFWAPWCGPCKVAAPKLEALNKELDYATFVKVNVDEEAELAQKYKVRSIPTFLVFSEGNVEKRIIGDVESLQACLESL